MAEACPAFPWRQQQDGAQKLFHSGNCAACHQAMFREPAAAAARGKTGSVLQAAEIVVAEEAQAQLPAKHLHGGACKPDLTTLAAKIQDGPLCNKAYVNGGAIGAATMPRMLADGVLACQEIKRKIALQFAQPYYMAA